MVRRRSDNPFDDLFREIERLMESMMGEQVDWGSGAAATTETHVGVHEYEDRVTVIADLPGVTKDAIDVQCSGDTLFIRASGPTATFAEQVPLPATVDETSANASFNNGVLEVRLDHDGGSAGIDVV